jgi:hypothetical protein
MGDRSVERPVLIYRTTTDETHTYIHALSGIGTHVSMFKE